jgi:phage repressor protein C with HTH and peptisase S24 domain
MNSMCQHEPMSLKLIRITRLKEFATSRGLEGPVAIGQAIGKKANQASDLISGKAPFGEKVARSIEAFAGLPENWLDSASGETKKIIETSTMRGQKNKPDELVIPQFKDTGGAMGSGLLLRDQPGEIRGWTVSQEWLSKNIKSHTGAANLCIITGFGDSMKGMFNSGDPLVVDRGVTGVEGDAVYFFRVDNEGFIKRLQRVPGKGLVVLSENKKYESWVIDKSMDFEVFGRVVKAWQGEDF